MTFDSATLTIRKPLWVALSDLFLDTELQQHDLAFIARRMHESGYSLEEINDILMFEVFPVCIANLHSVAGEWAGFDEKWVVNAILSAKRPNRFRRWMNRRSFWMIKNEWEAVLECYEKL
ncbi:hypothetical protein GCM10009133_33580 [Cocleimonas flava]|nr:hypothetical protein [Cocleimonas flava]